MIKNLKLNVLFLVIFLCTNFILRRQEVSAVRILKREVGGCMCSDFTWFRKKMTGKGSASTRGNFLGGCRTRNEVGDEFCYVHQPNNCTDASASSTFVGMDVSANACNCKFNRFGQCSKLPRNKRSDTSQVKSETANTMETVGDFKNDDELIPSHWM